jgi:hypothetical protein
MPVLRCLRNNKKGYRAVTASGEGDCFTYQPGNEAARRAAQMAAHMQLAHMVAESNDEDIRAVIESIACI